MKPQNPKDLGEVILLLADTIKGRRDANPEESYTAKLLQGHEDQLLKKIGEEATEVVMAAKDRDKVHLCYEAGDVVYHLLVVLERYGVTPEDLAQDLASRMK